MRNLLCCLLPNSKSWINESIARIHPPTPGFGHILRNYVKLYGFQRKVQFLRNRFLGLKSMRQCWEITIFIPEHLLFCKPCLWHPVIVWEVMMTAYHDASMLLGYYPPLPPMDQTEWLSLTSRFTNGQPDASRNPIGGIWWYVLSPPASLQQLAFRNILPLNVSCITATLLVFSYHETARSGQPYLLAPLAIAIKFWQNCINTSYCVFHCIHLMNEIWLSITKT